VTVKTTAGPVGLARPKLRGTSEAFASRLFGAHVTKTNALESLVIASFIRGLSVRDVEATLADALGGPGRGLQVHGVGHLQQITGEYERWARRRLDDVTLDYLFLDASFFRMHPGSRPSRCWPPGASHRRQPAFIGLAPGTGESADAWAGFLTDLTGRGLASPLLVISDGAPGLIAAIEQAYPKALRQRCLRGLHLTGVVQVGGPPRALRWWPLQARWMAARRWRGRRDRPWPLARDDVVVAHRAVAGSELEHPVEHQAAAGRAAGLKRNTNSSGSSASAPPRRSPGGCSEATAWPARRPGGTAGSNSPGSSPRARAARWLRRWWRSRAGQPVVAHPGIGDDGGARLDVTGDEGMQRGGGPVSQQRHAAPARSPSLCDLHRDACQDLLAPGPPPRSPGSSPPM